MYTLSFMKDMIRENGLLFCIKEGVKGISISLKKFIRRFAWIYPSFKFLIRSNSSLDKRILAIWDLQAVPYSIGDLLNLNQAMLCLSYIENVEKIDICFVCDPKRPAREPGESEIITSKNYQYHLNALIPVVQVNQKLGSFFLFDSYRDLEHFIEEKFERYIIWPDGKKYCAKEGYGNNFDFIIRFFKKYNYLPYLSCNEYSIQWACNFFKEYSLPAIPVIIHIRNNPNWSIDRNSRVDAWLELINYCSDKYPIKFFLIGLKNEIDERFRKFSNVFVIKDYHTAVEEDLALIQVSPLYLGVPSGMAQMAIFSYKPYLLVNFRPSNEKTISWGAQIPIAHENQKVIWKPETGEMLIKEFIKLYGSIDLIAWGKKINENEYNESKIRIR